MRTYRTFFRCRFRYVYVTAVTAFPHDRVTFLVHCAFFKVLQKFQETFLVLLFNLRNAFEELCNVAETNGVKIAIEVEPNQLFHNLKRFFEVADKVNSSAFKLNFDVGHIYLSEVDIDSAIEKSKDFIVYSHIENMCMGEHCHKLPWDGEIDLLSAYKKLKEVGYDGAVSLDIYLQDYEKVSPRCIEYINNEVFSKI